MIYTCDVRHSVTVTDHGLNENCEAFIVQAESIAGIDKRAKL